MAFLYYIIYKPYQVLTQFSAGGEKKTLKDFFDVPKDVYPVGRLDYDSEGLLILTNDTRLNKRLLLPENKHKREYWVQVDGAIAPEAISQLCKGVIINIDGKNYTTKPCKVSGFPQPPFLPERTPPVRFRKAIPTSWIRMELTEGKNRQVRKMTAAVGFPTLRLVRYSIEKITIEGMHPGAIKSLSEAEIHTLLFAR